MKRSIIRTLLVECDPGDARLVQEMLARATPPRHVVTAVQALDEVLEKLEREPVDLLLLALAPVEGQGLESLLQAQARAPSLPIVVLVSASDEELALRAVEQGAQDYLVKGLFGSRLLARTLCYAMERKQADLQFARYREQLEEMVAERTHALDERVKELNCLLSISALVEQAGSSLVDILRGTVHLMPPAWQYPEIARARIVLDGQEFKAPDFCETRWQQSHPIIVGGQPAGMVQVCYLEERPAADDGPFLAEERSLLQAIAERLGRSAEQVRAQASLAETNQLLEAILDSTHMLVAFMDPQFDFVRVNRAYAQADDREPAFFAGKNHFELYPNAENEAIFRRVVDSGKPFFAQARPFEYAEHPERGTSHWDWSLVPIKDAKGAIAGLVLTLADVTDRVQAQEALRAAHHELEERVTWRTAQLTEANLLLQSEIAEREQIEGDLRRTNRALQVLDACNQALLRAAGEADLLHDVCKIVVDYGGYRLAWVGFAQQDAAKTVLPVAQAGFEDGYLQTLNITWDETERGRGPSGMAIRTGRPVAARNILTDPHFRPWRDEAAKRGYASSLALPLKAADHCLGSLNIYAAEPDAFDEEEVRLLAELADNLAYGLVALRTRVQRQQAEAELAEKATELARSNAFVYALSQVSARVQTSLEPASVLETLGAELRELGLTCTVALLQPDGQTLEIHYTSIPARDIARAETEAGFRLEGHLMPAALWPAWDDLRQHRAQFLAHRAAAVRAMAPRTGEARLERITRLLKLSLDEPEVHVGLAVEERPIGVLAVAGKGLREADMPALSVFAQQVATAFERARLGREAAEAEILREVDRLRSELIGNVSHEIRTPLGLIEILCSSLLMDDVAFDLQTQRQFLTGIREETERLKAIVDNLLQLSRLESGRLHPDRRPTDLGQLAASIARSLEIQLAGHRLIHDFPESPLVVMAEARQIEQVLRNLLSNAIRYSPRGGTIAIQGRSQPGQALICVRDEGIGIPLEEQGRIFERFYRVQNEATRGVSGAGLGLAVCQGIVQAHGGRIWVESVPGQGSSFFFTLPAVSADHL